MDIQKSSLFPEGLEAYFTGAGDILSKFDSLLYMQRLTKRVLVIYGVGGVGKSSIMQMFFLRCKHLGIPAALASGDIAKSVHGVLSMWAKDLEDGGTRLPNFSSVAKDYQRVRAKLAKNVSKRNTEIAETLGKVAIDTATSTIPVLGPVLSMLGGLGVDAIVDYLSGFLTKREVELFLNHSDIMTEKFLSDIQSVAQKQRLVIILDTYEQMTALDDWIREVTQKIDPNILTVISGRIVPNWDRQWPGWMSNAEIIEHKPMSPDVMRNLVHRYYRTICGMEPEAAQVEAIIEFARGLPIVVTSAVRLWVQYGIEDFSVVKPQVVADLVDRITEGLPKTALPSLEAAAALRWFNKDILSTLTDQSNTNEIYNELRSFPFVRPRIEGLAIHDSVREIIDENTKIHNPSKHRMLHEKATEYFGHQFTIVEDEKAESYILEQLYHRVRADERSGIKYFRRIVGDLETNGIVNQFRTIMNDANTYPLEREDSRLWLEYYNLRLAQLESRLVDIESCLEQIGENEQADPLLRAYALSDLGEILSTYRRLRESGTPERALDTIRRSLELAPQIDSKLARIFWYIRGIHTYQGEPEKGIDLLQQQLLFFERNDNRYGTVYTLASLRHMFGSLGYWREAFQMAENGLEVLKVIPENEFLHIRLNGHSPWHLIWTGQYTKAENEIRRGLTFMRKADNFVGEAQYLSNLILVLGLQNKFSEASKAFHQATRCYERLGEDRLFVKAMGYGFWGAVLKKQGNMVEAEKCLLESLSLKHSTQISGGIPELFNWLGELYELRANNVVKQDKLKYLYIAQKYYEQSLDLSWTQRHHYECCALVGLARIKYASCDYDAEIALLAKAEQLASRYEYNDHLASIRLLQGHLAWNGLTVELEKGFEAAVHYYQHALVYALRYNRFLLDELLSGPTTAATFSPIIQHCTEKSDEGVRMISVLQDWWRTGLNSVGVSRPDTISEIPEEISLLEAESFARKRELGDASGQQSLVQQFTIALH